MAVKAQVSITISHLIDISSITRYYLLQSSTSAAPAKPTTVPALIGKNLIPYPYNCPSTSKDGIAFNVASDGTITISGTSTATSGTTNFFLTRSSVRLLHLNIGSKYTLSGFSSGTANCGIRLHQTNYATLHEINSTAKTISFEAKFETWYMWVFVKAGKTVNATFKPQLEVGTTATAYQKYVTPNWQLTEPAYTSGSTNTLYFVDCTEFTNGTFKYSEVSKSSSYEAAKEAYNKAQEAQNRVISAETKIEQNKNAIALRATKTEMSEYIASRKENLVTNGSASLGDNTNFSTFIYDPANQYYSNGSFRIVSKSTTRGTDEYIPVDINQRYTLSYMIKSSSPTARYFDFLQMYDADKNVILDSNVLWISGSTTTLAKELKSGDTTITLTSVAGFNATDTPKSHRGLIVWDYKNSKGYQYPVESYSRNVYTDLWADANSINKTTNVITLKTAWKGRTIPAGTSVSQSSSGGTYNYMNDDYTLGSANTWVQKTGNISAVAPQSANRHFREGTAFVGIYWLINYSGATDVTTWITNVNLTCNASSNDVNGIRNDLEDQGKALNTRIDEAYASLETNAKSINASVEKLQTTFEENADSTSKAISELREKVNLQLTEDSVNIQIDKKLQNGVNRVETSTGFKFDENGINVSKKGADTSTQITENGMSVLDVNETDPEQKVVLKADKDGVDAKNLRASTYLVIGGRSRFENYGAYRTGCFWIGPSSGLNYPVQNATVLAEELKAENTELKQSLQDIKDGLDGIT